jgi:hypothetical protein
MSEALFPRISALGGSLNRRREHPQKRLPSQMDHLQHSQAHSSQGVPQHAPPQAQPPHVQPLPQQSVFSMLTSFSRNSFQAPAEAHVLTVVVCGQAIPEILCSLAVVEEVLAESR